MEKQIESRVTYECPIFTVEERQVALDDGSIAPRNIVHHNGGAAAVFVQDGKLCLVRQFRSSLNRETLELPAGRTEIGESGADTAARELLEETGYTVIEMHQVCRSLGSPGWTNEKTDIFIIDAVSEKIVQQQLDGDENVRVVWLPIDEVLQRIYAGIIQDSKTIIGIFAYLYEQGTSLC